MNVQEKAVLLSRNSLFSVLKPQQIEEILSRFNFPVVTYEEGKWIAFRGEAYERLAIFLRGQARAELTDPSGHTMVIETLAAPQIMASAVFFGKRNVLPVSVVATSRLEVLYIERPQLMKLFQESLPVLQAFLEDIGGRIQFLAQKLHMMSFASIRQKIAVFLIDAAGRIDPTTAQTTLTLRHTKQEMADIFGIARPSLSRVFGRLEEEGLIQIAGKKVTILQPGRLLRLAQSVREDEN